MARIRERRVEKIRGIKVMNRDTKSFILAIVVLVALAIVVFGFGDWVGNVTIGSGESYSRNVKIYYSANRAELGSELRPNSVLYEGTNYWFTFQAKTGTYFKRSVRIYNDERDGRKEDDLWLPGCNECTYVVDQWRADTTLVGDHFFSVWDSGNGDRQHYYFVVK